MKIRHILACTATIALATGSVASAVEISDIVPAASDKLELYKEVGDWSIFAVTTRGSCLMERSDDVGNAMQMGLTKDQSAVYVGVFTKAPTDIKPNQPIAIAVDGQVYAGESYGIRSGTVSGNYSGGYVLSSDPDFVSAIAKGYELVAFPGEKGLFIVDLTGTYRAIEEAKKCRKSLGS